MVPSCAEGGVLGILPGVIGSLQATETIKVLLGIGETLSGRLLTYDAMNMKFKEFKLRQDPDAKPITELIDYQQFCGVPANDHQVSEAQSDSVVEITPAGLKDKLIAAQIQLLDVESRTNGISAISRAQPSFPWVNSRTE